MEDDGKINESIFARHSRGEYDAIVLPIWELYATGYKEAADKLVDEAANGYLDFVYPAMFLYRHYLELRLKYVLLALQNYLDQPTNIPFSHSLLYLWRKVKPLWEQMWSGDDSIATHDAAIDDAIEARLKEFEMVDRGSSNFRYPFDKDNLPSLKKVPGENGYQVINLYQVREVINRVALILDGVSDVIAVQEDLHTEYEDVMRTEFDGAIGSEWGEF